MCCWMVCLMSCSQSSPPVQNCHHSTTTEEGMMRALVATTVILVAASAAALVLGQQGEAPPFLASVPETTFSCADRPYGYYADVEANCQVFHICHNNAMWSFLCPNQTLFNQEYFVCDHFVNVDCSLAPTLYSLNDNFGRIEEVEEENTEAPPQ